MSAPQPNTNNRARAVSGPRSRPVHALESADVLKSNRCRAVGKLVRELKKRFVDNGCPLPLTQVDDFVYQLGSRKVTLNVISNKLVVRLGGGFTDFLEFLEKARF